MANSDELGLSRAASTIVNCRFQQEWVLFAHKPRLEPKQKAFQERVLNVLNVLNVLGHCLLSGFLRKLLGSHELHNS